MSRREFTATRVAFLLEILNVCYVCGKMGRAESFLAENQTTSKLVHMMRCGGTRSNFGKSRNSLCKVKQLAENAIWVRRPGFGPQRSAAARRLYHVSASLSSSKIAQKKICAICTNLFFIILIRFITMN